MMDRIDEIRARCEAATPGTFQKLEDERKCVD